MKSLKNSGGFKPFTDIKTLLHEKHPKKKLPPKAKKLPTEQTNERPTPKSQPTAKCPDDKELFLAAMKDVTPIDRDNHIHPTPRPRRLHAAARARTDDEIVKKLECLVQTGSGFVVHQTPEYMEGISPNVDKRTAARLRKGKFSIQAHLDLHGLNVQEAREAMDEFLKSSVSEGKRVVLVIHGRGLSSPAGPVLKTKVFEWLQCSPWNKWVLAFTSARLIDGGAGATYVMLRSHPARKNQRKS